MYTNAMIAPEPRPGPRYPALLNLLRTADVIWHASRTFFDPWNLSPSQFNVLNLLHGLPEGRSQSDLSRELLVHRSNVTGLVDRLERDGLVERRDEPGDRRAYQVRLTAAGRRLVDQILPYYYDAAERVWGGIPAARIRELELAFQQLGRNADRMASQLAQSARFAAARPRRRRRPADGRPGGPGPGGHSVEPGT